LPVISYSKLIIDSLLAQVLEQIPEQSFHQKAIVKQKWFAQQQATQTPKSEGTPNSMCCSSILDVNSLKATVGITLLLNLKSIYHVEARTANQQQREGFLSLASFSQNGKS